MSIEKSAPKDRLGVRLGKLTLLPSQGEILGVFVVLNMFEVKTQHRTRSKKVMPCDTYVAQVLIPHHAHRPSVQVVLSVRPLRKAVTARSASSFGRRRSGRRESEELTGGMSHLRTGGVRTPSKRCLTCRRRRE